MEGFSLRDSRLQAALGVNYAMSFALTTRISPVESTARAEQPPTAGTDTVPPLPKVVSRAPVESKRTSAVWKG